MIPMTILIVAGGTGGHFYPGVALAEELAKENDIIFVCSNKESHLVERYSLQYETIDTIKLQPYQIIKLSNIKKLFTSFSHSSRIIRSYTPDLIIGMGGYLSFPIVLVGFLLRIPIFLHEQNIIPGRATRLSSVLAKKIFISFEETKKYFNSKKVVVSGNPIRKINNNVSLERFYLKKGKKLILVFGGSQGAKKINETVKEMLPLLSDYDLQILHITGNSQKYSIFDEITTTNFNKLEYVTLPYTDNLLNLMQQADLVIARAGATTCYEVISLRKVAILIPYPYAIGRHQYYNARYLHDRAAAIMIENDKLTAEKLSSAILNTLFNEENLNTLQHAINSIPFYNAQKIIREEIIKTLQKR